MPSKLFNDIKDIPAPLGQQYYPSLNGIRAVSIILVVFCHLFELYTNWGSNLGFIGPLGVNIFFVISGFLITTLCIKEKMGSKNLSLKNFYMRRALRIIPVAYLYILFIIIINYACKLGISNLNFLGALFFLSDTSYFGHLKFDWDLAHYWSLSVEEQFYLFLPFFIKINLKGYIVIILLLVFGVPLLICCHSIIPFLKTSALSGFLRYAIKFQGISVGCLFSILLFKGYLDLGKYKFVVTVFSLVMIVLLKYNAEILKMDPSMQNFDVPKMLVNLAISIFTGFIIINNISARNDLIYKFLNLRALNFIGILSYSIYIWQQVFLSNDARFPLSKWPVNLIFLFAAPLASYFFYEKIFLDIKKRFVQKGS